MYNNIRNEILKETGKETLITDREIDIIRKEVGRKEVKRLNWLSERNERDKIFKELGGFYFQNYENVLKLNIAKQYLFRFIYLCTYMSYDKKIHFGNAIGEKSLALEKDLKEIFRLSKSETINTKNTLIENGLIIINKDKTINVNSKYAIKGEIEKRELKMSVKVMEKGIREVYRKSKATEHKKLALLIELLPYVNFRHNVICSNPEESDVEKINPFNLTEVMRIAEYKNLTRFKRDLLNLTVNEELAVKITETKYGKFVYVNPRIFYKGNNADDLKSCMNEFKIKKNN